MNAAEIFISKEEAKKWALEHDTSLPRPGHLVRLVRSNIAHAIGINDMALYQRNGQWIICPIKD